MANEKVKKIQEATKEGAEAAAEALRACKERTDAAVEAIRKLPDEALEKPAGGICADFTGYGECEVDYYYGRCEEKYTNEHCKNRWC